MLLEEFCNGVATEYYLRMDGAHVSDKELPRDGCCSFRQVDASHSIDIPLLYRNMLHLKDSSPNVPRHGPRGHHARHETLVSEAEIKPVP
jgi:hypothetical protein